jgi:hypothetical protein
MRPAPDAAGPGRPRALARRSSALALAALCAAAFAAAHAHTGGKASGGPYVLQWLGLGGGDGAAAGAGFQASGRIDATATVLAGGSFQVAGGPLVAAPAPTAVGVFGDGFETR